MGNWSSAGYKFGILTAGRELLEDLSLVSKPQEYGPVFIQNLGLTILVFSSSIHQKQ